MQLECAVPAANHLDEYSKFEAFGQILSGEIWIEKLDFLLIILIWTLKGNKTYDYCFLILFFARASKAEHKLQHLLTYLSLTRLGADLEGKIHLWNPAASRCSRNGHLP